MKLIKSILPVIGCLAAVTSIKAQDIKTELRKNYDQKTPPAETVTKIPSPLPQLQPVDGVMPPDASVDKSNPPATTNANASNAGNRAPKATLLSSDGSGITGHLSPEQLKTLNGTAEKPKELNPVTPAAPVADTPANTKHN
ncbi:MAG: hypothetical protein U0X40_11925 [Ferruginibacter sp.]